MESGLSSTRSYTVRARASPLNTEMKRNHLLPPPSPSARMVLPLIGLPFSRRLRKAAQAFENVLHRHADANVVIGVEFGGIFLSSTRQTLFLILSACFSLSLSGASQQLPVTEADSFPSLAAAAKGFPRLERGCAADTLPTCVVGKKQRSQLKWPLFMAALS